MGATMLLLCLFGALFSAGIALAYLWLLTAHVTSYANENLLHFFPLSLALVALIPLSVHRPRSLPAAA